MAFARLWRDDCCREVNPIQTPFIGFSLPRRNRPSVCFKGELWCKNKDFSKERPTIIASNFPIPVALSYKLESNSAIEVDLKCD